jgi:hypothetical protein
MTTMTRIAINILKTYTREDLIKSTDKIVLKNLDLDIEDFEEELFDFRLSALIDLDLNGIEYDNNKRRKNQQKILKEIFERELEDDEFEFLQHIVVKSHDLEIDNSLNEKLI